LPDSVCIALEAPSTTSDIESSQRQPWHTLSAADQSQATLGPDPHHSLGSLNMGSARQLHPQQSSLPYRLQLSQNGIGIGRSSIHQTFLHPREEMIWFLNISWTLNARLSVQGHP
jgi:hypothetical protein